MNCEHRNKATSVGRSRAVGHTAYPIRYQRALSCKPLRYFMTVLSVGEAQPLLESSLSEQIHRPALSVSLRFGMVVILPLDCVWSR